MPKRKASSKEGPVKRARRAKEPTLKHYVRRLSDSVGIAKCALPGVSQIARRFINQCSAQLPSLMSENKTVLPRDIEAAVKLVAGPHRLTDRMIQKAAQAVRSWAALKKSGATKMKGQRTERRIGLVFPVERIRRYIARGSGRKVQRAAAAAMAAASQELIESVLRHAEEHMRADKRKRIKAVDVWTAVKRDVDLSAVIDADDDASMACGGIGKAVAPPPAKRRRTKQ